MTSEEKDKTGKIGESSMVQRSPMTDPSSPFYLTSADNHGIIITLAMLTGDNYDEWMKALHNALKAKRKLAFIDDHIQRPAKTDPYFDDWSAVNAMLVGLIFNIIDQSLHLGISYMESMQDLWEDLKERFFVGNDMRVYQLKSEISSFKQSGMNLSAYYNFLKGMWEELGAYVKQPTCTCGCKCRADKELRCEREKKKVYKFLMGLNDFTYRTVCSNILSTIPLPNLNQIHAHLMNKEIHHTITIAKDERAEAFCFAIQAKLKPPARQDDRKPICGNYNKPGHNLSKCFQLIGYPEWWYFGKDGQLSATHGGRGRCIVGHGNRRGHGQVANAIHLV